MVAGAWITGHAELFSPWISLHTSGGPQGSRTPDLRRAKAALSQLS
jgi:hypothetical protein